MNHRRIRVGEQLPLVGTRLGSLWTLRDGKVKRLPLADIFYEGSKVVLFAVPGPFTPGCTRVHLPSFQEQRAALARAGATDVVCVAVSDPFVMHAWAVQCAREHAPRDGEYAASPTGGVLLLADPHLELTRALGMELGASRARPRPLHALSR